MFAGPATTHRDRDRLRAVNAWYGDPRATPRSAAARRRCARWAALAGYAGDADTLDDPGRLLPARVELLGAGRRPRVPRALRDRRHGQRPAAARPERAGRRACSPAGARSGSDPVVLDATDNAGVRRVELHDVTGRAAARRVRGLRRGRADRGRGDLLGAARQDLPGPGARGGPRRPRCRPAGGGCSCARSTRAATRSTAARTRSTSPRRRTAGRATASGATDSATLSARFKGRKRRTRTVDYGDRVRVVGRLVNDAGQPDRRRRARAAHDQQAAGRVDVHAQDVPHRARRDVQHAHARARSRRLEIAWKSHLNDTSYAAAARLRLRTRAAATLRRRRAGPPSAARSRCAATCARPRAASR